ncbi:unnamed protein product [Lupinus luteus]|uniref:DHFR domain-containing protein n=1 Tax=Lupinus luteus TaxID=3873 RepID=A0AAV1YKJ7_LUPLU
MERFDHQSRHSFSFPPNSTLSETLNAPGCEAAHITEIEASIECDTFMPQIDTSIFQLWYSSFPLVENNIRYSFNTYVRVRSCPIESLSRNNDPIFYNNSNNTKFEVHKFSFLPKMIFDIHEEYKYLRLVQEIISEGNTKDDRTGTGTLSKFGYQVLQEKGIHIWDGNASREYLDRQA